MVQFSAEALERIAQGLPETYAEHPEQFETDWQAAQAARQDVDRLRNVSQWYEESYVPWWREHGKDFAEFQEWKQRRTEPEPPASHGPESIVTPGSWQFDDPADVRRAYDHMMGRLDEIVTQTTARADLLQQTLDQRTQDIQRLLALKEQADQIIAQAAYDKIEPGWRPKIDMPAVVRYAQEHNIGDLHQAYAGYTQADREKELERRAYERGREEARREAAGQAVTTEMTSGVPFRHVAPEQPRRSRYGTDYDKIIAAARERTARRFAS